MGLSKKNTLVVSGRVSISQVLPSTLIASKCFVKIWREPSTIKADTNHHYKRDVYKPWEYEYDPKEDCFTCPHGGKLRHTTTDRDGKRTYRSDTKYCKSCPFKTKCGANEKGQKLLTTHIWQEYLDLVEQLRRTERGKEIYAMRKETIERVFADAKEKHAMRYTHHRGLARVTSWVRLKYAAMNLKKLAEWSWNNSFFHLIASLFSDIYADVPAFA